MVDDNVKKISAHIMLWHPEYSSDEMNDAKHATSYWTYIVNPIVHVK